MSRKTPEVPTDDEGPRPGESILQRLHRRKAEARLATNKTAPVAPDPGNAPLIKPEGPDSGSPSEPTDADMPPMDSLTAESDYRGFLSARVSESLRRAALRKLFHSAQFNVIDELDDYAEDFTAFASLGDIVTADMRHRIEIEAKRTAERVAQSLEDDAATEGPGAQPTASGPAVPDSRAGHLVDSGAAAASPSPRPADEPPGET